MEQASPGSQPLEIAGRVPFMWAQSLYIVGRLLKENLVALGEIDPMNRRLGIQTKPEVVVQVSTILSIRKPDIYYHTVGILNPTIWNSETFEIRTFESGISSGLVFEWSGFSYGYSYSTNHSKTGPF